MNRVLFLVLAILPAVPALAAEEWVQIHQSTTGNTQSIDKASIKREADSIRFTEKIVFATPRPFRNGIGLKTMIGSYSVRCADSTIAMLSGDAFSDTGTHIEVTPPEKVEYESIDATRPDARAFAYICKEEGAP